MAWQDGRNGDFDVFAQHVTASGAIALGWPSDPPDGVPICTALGDQSKPVITPDGAGGAIVAWQDARNGNLDIFSQHVTGSGSVAAGWSADGVAISTATGDQALPTISTDGAGGAIAAWRDARNCSLDIFASRVYSSGAVAGVPPEDKEPFRLFLPYPNPTHDNQLTIRFMLPSAQKVSARVVDLSGHRVRTLVLNREFSPGPQALFWDGRSDTGARSPSGVYFIQVRAGAHSAMRRVVLLH